MDLDLNIQHYSVADLEAFLGFASTGAGAGTYTDVDIDNHVYKIREILLQSGNVDKHFKTDLVQFLEKIKKRLHDEVILSRQRDDASATYSRVPSSLPKQMRRGAVAAVTAMTAACDSRIAVHPREKKPVVHQHELLVHTPKTVSLFENETHVPRPFQVLNPNEKRITTKMLCVDTLFRTNYLNTTSSDFLYKLNESISNVVSMNLVSIEIPFYWYTISGANHNNSFRVSVRNLVHSMPAVPAETTTYTLVIPDGNYTSSQITQVINNMFLQLSPDPARPNGLNALTCTIDPLNLKTVIRVCDIAIDAQTFANNRIYPYAPTTATGATNPWYSPTFSFTLDFSFISPAASSASLVPTYRSFGWTLGFRRQTYTVTFADICESYTQNVNYTNLLNNAVFYNSMHGYISSEAAYGSSIDNYLFVAIDDFHNNYPSDTVCMVNNYNKSMIGKNIIGRITLAQNFNSVILDNNSDFIFKKREYFGPVNIEKMQISLLNRYGETIDINNQDFSMTLELKQMYS